ncbi:MAG: hypothetical protein R3C05_04125 [Pirellulaceae bacterium]
MQPPEEEIVEAEALPPRTSSPRVANQSNRWITDIAENRLMVLGTLFLVTGVLGLPFLWISSKFTRLQKISLSIVVTIYTVLLIVAVVWVLMWSWSRIERSMS